MKTIDEIYSELKTDFETESGITINEGGDLALRFRAFAAQLVSLFAQADFVERQCFPQTATGSALDTHAAQRGLTRTAAANATGTLRFSLQSAAAAAVSIPVGTRCITAEETEFEVTAAGTIAVGSTYCDVAAKAVNAGKSGNVSANTVCYMELAPTGVYACTNPAAFSGGCDAESDDSLRERVLDSFVNVPNSGNVSYYRNLALTDSDVAAVTVQPRLRGRGTVDINIATESGVPSATIINRVSRLFNGRREICVDVYVNAPTTQAVNVTAAITAADGYDISDVYDNVWDALDEFFTGKLLGKGVKLAEISSVIFGAEGVETFTLTAPTADLAASPAQLPVKGTVTLSEAT